MKIIVVGCGKIGTSIIRSLVNEDHDVTVVDSSEEAIAEISGTYDVMYVCGNCTDVNVLNEANVSSCELFISVTASDETNMLACFFAKKLGAKNTLARIRESEFSEDALSFVSGSLDIDFTLNPEKLIARDIYNSLSLPSAAKAQFFSSQKLEMIELKLRKESLFDGIPLCNTRDITKAQFNVCAVQRGDEVFIPNGDFVLHSGDRIGITATKENLKLLFKDLKISVHNKKGSVIIFGGSRTSAHLAKMIYEDKGSSIIIEKNREVCERLAYELDRKAHIFLADGSRKDVLLEHGLADAHAFVSLTGLDEENILISYFAMQNEVPIVISKVNSVELIKMAESIGLDINVNPGTLVSDMVIRYARGLQNTLDTTIETVYSLFDSQAEAIEFKAGQSFLKLGKKLSEMNIRKDINIAGIVRNSRNIIPDGQATIELGDSVVIVTTKKRFDNLNSILA